MHVQEVEEFVRLSDQLSRVKQWLYENVGRWVIVPDFDRRRRGEGTAAITARIRDLRKSQHGGHEILCRRREKGLYEYKLLARSK